MIMNAASRETGIPACTGLGLMLWRQPFDLTDRNVCFTHDEAVMRR